MGGPPSLSGGEAQGQMDRDLVERARSGDQQAFADLVQQISRGP
jgi:hypothetical protein